MASFNVTRQEDKDYLTRHEAHAREGRKLVTRVKSLTSALAAAQAELAAFDVKARAALVAQNAAFDGAAPNPLVGLVIEVDESRDPIKVHTGADATDHCDDGTLVL